MMDVLQAYFPAAFAFPIRVNTSAQYYLCCMADRERFLDLLNPHRTALFQYARAIARDTEDVRDIVGETICAALEGIEEVKKEESFRFFLFKIARRKSWRLLMRKKLFIPLETKHEELRIDEDANAETSYDVALLMNALHKLPFKVREAISLYELSGFSIAEIHALQGGSLSGVKSRLVRGRLQLRASLSDLNDQSLSQDSEESSYPGGEN
jgi:RNA polymerase sigma-70 factor, ECF subfamily